MWESINRQQRIPARALLSILLVSACCSSLASAGFNASAYNDQLRERVSGCRDQGWSLDTPECADMPHWDTGNVTDMSALFQDDRNFNVNISAWDTSRVTDMSYMFDDARIFNQDLSRWDTSRVTDMSYMFHDARVFDGDVSSWDTSSVTNMEYMFDDAEEFNGDLSRWDTSSVTNMEYMFYDAEVFNGDLSLWDTSSVTDMECMFCYAEDFQGNISRWNTGKVTTMLWMFYDAYAFDGDVGRWDVSNVEDMSGMFYECCEDIVFDTDFSAWNTSKVTDMSEMFEYVYDFAGTGLSEWDTSRVTTMYYMFYEAEIFNDDLSRWDTSSVTDMECMFCYAYQFQGNISRWNTGKVSTMEDMFYEAYAFDGDVGPWDVSNVEDMSSMFYYCCYYDGSGIYSTVPFDTDFSAWNTSKVTTMDSMFEETYFFTGSGLSEWDTSRVTDMEDMFHDSYLFNDDLSRWDTSRVTDMESMFEAATNFNGDISGWNIGSVRDMDSMFEDAESFNIDLCGWNIDNVNSLSNVFRDSGKESFCDINECLGGLDNCEATAMCNNNDGSFSCDCLTGFDREGNETCMDLDECVLGSHNCHDDAECTNTFGSFECACRDGFETVDAAVTCVPGVDECAAGIDNCHEQATCNNTLGSFTCTCNAGYSDSANGTICSDVDECPNKPRFLMPGEYPVWFNGNRSEWHTLDTDFDDEAFFQTLPFPFQFHGRELSTDGFWVSDNSLFTFEEEDSSYYETASVSDPPQLSLHIGYTDTVAYWLGYRDVSEDGLAGRAYYFDGHYYDTELASQWEVVFFADNTIRMAHVVRHPARTFQYGIADGAESEWVLGGTDGAAPWDFPDGVAVLFPPRVDFVNTCQSDQVCTNTVGSFTCTDSCGPGYDEVESTCVEKEVCEENVQWSNCRQSSCCAYGLVCYEQNEWYAQCLLPNTCDYMYGHLQGTAHAWSCEALSSPALPVCEPEEQQPEWGNCAHSHCCADGLVCYEQNPWYAQCLQPGTCGSLYGHMTGHYAWTCNELSARAAPFGSLAISGGDREAAALSGGQTGGSGGPDNLAVILGLMGAGLLLVAVAVVVVRRSAARSAATAQQEAHSAYAAGLHGLGLKGEIAYGAPPEASAEAGASRV